MAARTPNDRLSEAMRSAGLSSKGLARRLQDLSRKRGRAIACDHTSVSRWLAGTMPRAETARLVAEVLTSCSGRTVTLADVGLSRAEPIDASEAVLYSSGPAETVDVVTRLWSADLDEARAVLTSPIVASSWSDAALTWLVQSPRPASADKPIAVGAADLMAVRSTVSMFSQLDGSFGGAHARRALIEFLRSDVLPLLGEKHSNDVEGGFQEVAAEATLLAAWMAYDAGLHGLAQRYFVQALHLADAAHARLLGASILDAMSHQATFLGHTHDAVNLARAARAGAVGLAPPSLEAHFYAMEARALAAAGESSAAERALSTSVRVFERREAGSDPDWFGYFDDAELSAEFAHCFRDLGRSKAAVTYAERGISGLSPRSDFFVLMVQAVGHLGTPGRGDAQPDAACAAALAALKIGGNMKSARCIQYARDFRTKLAPYAGARAVREFAEAGEHHPVWRMTDPAAGRDFER